MIVLNYGPQGAQQAGAAILLEYTQAVVGTMVRSGRYIPWGGSKMIAIRRVAPMPNTRYVNPPTDVPWGAGVGVDESDRAAWGLTDTIDAGAEAPWGGPMPQVQPVRQTVWGRSATVDDRNGVPWGGPLSVLQAVSLSVWGMSKPADDRAGAPWGGPMAARALRQWAGWAVSAAADMTQWVPWTKYSQQLRPGWMVVVPDNPVIIDEHGTLVVPILKVYHMLNDVTLVRKSDGKPIHCTDMSLSLDVASWTWAFSATILPHHFEDVRRSAMGVPVELTATVNSHPVSVIVDDITSDRTYRSKMLRVSGRGLSAVLDAPYAPSLVFDGPTDLTAQQLANRVLSDNGIPLGWDLDWQMADWLVPAASWNTQGTYMQALNDIATAAGGYVQPHDTLQTLRFLKRYPDLPRTWATVTPHVELPADIVEVEGITYVDKPVYNRVYVGGQVNGVMVVATALGTAGDLLAPMVSHPLTTHVDAGRGRAEFVLSDVGAQAHVQLKVPVLEDIGLIKPGMYVRYTDGAVVRLGLARSISVTASHEQSWQTLRLETHV